MPSDAVLEAAQACIRGLPMEGEGPTMLSVHDLLGHYLYVDEHAAKVTGWDPEGLIGDAAGEYLATDDIDAVSEAFTHVVEHRRPVAMVMPLRGRGDTMRGAFTIFQAMEDPERDRLLLVAATRRLPDVPARLVYQVLPTRKASAPHSLAQPDP